ncbi:hypothetical protein SAMN05421736_104172 [Evansella caseinilytica]|uniref:Uncharacterized protein n=1 Tax=Evansella caseinilytica TaxID=1503961 RepID=A0A1H3NSG0_9BACI|nr:hypothetical protein [Evansella caseinilytica]SDY91365.1 hypothetical protein SAMN05421736_104172 [Evansella caseinilytica]
MTSLFILCAILIFSQLLFALWAQYQETSYRWLKYLFSAFVLLTGFICVSLSFVGNSWQETSFASIGVTMIVTTLLTVPLIKLLFSRLPLSKKQSN